MKTNYGIDQHEYKRLTENAVLSSDDIQKIRSLTPTFFIENGKIKMLLKGKKSQQDICIIDALNVTFKKETITPKYTAKNAHNIDNDIARLEDERALFNDYIIELSKQLESIFGYGITSERPTGIHFYNRSFVLGDGYGFVGIGGQQETVLVSITGTGCQQSSDKWEERLYNFLLNSVQPQITRIDIAHDDFTGQEFNIEKSLEQYHQGGFTCYRKPPQISQVGNYLTDDTKGRTIYIGSRDSDKYLRIYEKGKQLESNEAPNWVRCEVEFHNRDTIIPLDVLLNPHQFFSASYPIFNGLNTIHRRIETIQHEVKADLDHSIFHAKRQTGSIIKLLLELGYSSDAVIETLKRDKMPKKFVRKYLDNPFKPIHESQAQAVVGHSPRQSNNIGVN